VLGCRQTSIEIRLLLDPRLAKRHEASRERVGCSKKGRSRESRKECDMERLLTHVGPVHMIRARACCHTCHDTFESEDD